MPVSATLVRSVESGGFMCRTSSATAVTRVRAFALRVIPAIFLGGAGFMSPSSASAESLFEALSATYLTNPTINAKRAELRAIDESVPAAKAGLRPTISQNIDAGVQRTNVGLPAGAPPGFGSEGKSRPTGYDFQLNQPLFRGGRTVAEIREANANVQAGREDLRNTEQTTFLNAVTAFVDVVRDRAIVRLNENNIKVLAEQLKATKDRFEVGEVTKTDVAQAEARLSGSKSDLSVAQANLKSSRATYEQIVGHAPGPLIEAKPIDRLLPSSLNDALRVGEAENPAILQTVFLEKSAKHAIKRVKGELLPELSFEASYSKRYEPSNTVEDTETATFVGRVTVPLYQGGGVAARVRQAKETKRQRLRQIGEARAQVRAAVISAWGQLTSTRAQIVSDQAQVRANQIALNGVREEEKVGQRTVLDVLDAEQELLDSQVELVGSKRDAVVASYSLLQAIGRLSVPNLSLSVAEYDPDEHYRRVKNKLFGLNPDSPSLLYRFKKGMKAPDDRPSFQ